MECTRDAAASGNTTRTAANSDQVLKGIYGFCPGFFFFLMWTIFKILVGFVTL